MCGPSFVYRMRGNCIHVHEHERAFDKAGQSVETSMNRSIVDSGDHSLFGFDRTRSFFHSTLSHLVSASFPALVA
jgi:hypothetical protein